ncbi:MAG: IgGFc-binding protein, partial [Bacteroidota bacterium]
MRYSVILSILFFFILANSFAQTDTEFWFVAPEVSKNGGSNFDIPIYLRITTFNDPATVTVSEPANGGFTPIVINIPANGFSTIDLSPFLDMVENKPANTVLNYGIHIVASAPVSIYYEIASTYCLCNPELYTLKGKNAVGSDFLIPTQNFFSNAGGYSPTPYNAFDIVATDDNTAVTITPSKDIVGHAQGIPFVINLGKGQTWSALATSQLAANHLFGSKVTSTKPIAITMTDDLLYGITGCADIIGDQIVPVGITGKEYIAVKGNLTNDGNRAFILATQDATQVFIDGNPVPVATLNTGQLYNDDILASSAYIVTDKPVYVFQTSGFGCELGGALLPPILCTGSTRVVFARTTNQQLGLVISTHNGNQGNFLVNGDATMITAANFLPVPGTGGSWVSANLTLSLLQIPVGTTVSVTNSSGTFHLGLMIGNAGGGCSYGYYSDFSRLNLGPDQVMCAGSTKVLDAGPGWTSYLWNTGEITQSIPVNFPGTYSVTATDPGCSLTDTAVVSLYPVQAVSLGPDFALCNGLTQTITASGGPFTSYLWNTGAISSSIVVNSPGTYSVSVIDNNGCAGADTIHVTAAQGPLLTNNPASQAQCTGVPTAITLTADQPGSVFTRTASGSSPNVSGYSAGPGAFIDDILENSG